MLHVRVSSREIPCDEYLRLRLRKSKTIRFNHREGGYETGCDSPIDFLRHVSTPELLFPSKYTDYSALVTFLYYIGITIRYLAPEKMENLKFIISSPSPTCYLCVRWFDFQNLQSRWGPFLFGIHRALLLLYSIPRLDARGIYARRTMIRHALLVLGYAIPT